MTTESSVTGNINTDNSAVAVNLLDLSQQALADFFVSIGEPAFRAVQWIKWVHQLGVTDYTAMTNFSNALRQKLAATAVIKLPEVVYEHISEDGTRKWLIRLYDGQCIETVFIPEKSRGTLCVSSQVGCIVNCDFCSTARQGFNRNLSIGEIIGQVWLAVRRLSANGTSRGHEVRNVVMMGMGEPLLNFDAVVGAMGLMLEDNAYNLSKYRVTLSTSGIVPKILELATQLPVALAVSLHAPNDELRNQLVPINKKYPLSELMAACRRYFLLEPRRHITFEYVMLDGINDSEALARELVKLLRGMEAKVNLIPFNPFPQTNYQRSRPEAIERFRKILLNAGINTIVRKTRGDDIDAACGQLVGRVQDRSHRQAQYQVITQRVTPKTQIEGGIAQ